MHEGPALAYPHANCHGGGSAGYTFAYGTAHDNARRTSG
jgi:hypothetical protein